MALYSYDDWVECPWCGQVTRLEQVRGHLSCPVCKRPVADCCDGETAEEAIDDREK